jgi:polysaccharide export outer membrane protein
VSVRIVFGFLLAMLMAACASVPTAGPASGSGERYVASTAALEDYKLGVGDKVRVTVFNEPTLSGEFSVGANGSLSLPLIGDVDVSGKGPNEIGTMVQTRLADGYLRDPKVSVEVTTYRPFFILGEVKAPGQYPYVSGLTVLNAIATAQGFTPRADRRTVFIRKSGSAEEAPYGLTPDLRVMPGDTLRLGERYF